MNLSEQVARLEAERDELRRHLGKVMSERDFFKVDRDALLYNRDSLIHDLEMAEAELANRQAERDQLKARIDAGVRVYARPHSLNSGLIIETVPGQGAQPCLLIDVETIAQVDADRPTWTRADGSTNPRVGERRKLFRWAPWRINETAETVGKFRDMYNSNDRRKA
jgi:regulator of replication initiation timing